MSEAEAWAVALEGDRPALVIEHLLEYAVTVEPAPDVLVVAVGEQGPPGPPGPAGGGAGETNPAFTYTAGLVTRIDYSSGAHKLFTYTAGVLTQLDYVVGVVTTRKAFFYNPDGSLHHITEASL